MLSIFKTTHPFRIHEQASKIWGADTGPPELSNCTCGGWVWGQELEQQEGGGGLELGG